MLFRSFFLPYPDSPYSDPPEIKAAMRLMLRDPYVKSAWLSNVLTVAAQDIQVHASDDNDPLAKQEADFARRCLENAEGGVPGLVTAILNPLGADGYSLCEKVWQVDAFGLDRGRITLRKLKAKRPDRVRLHGDRFDNVTGVRSVLDQLMWPITDFVYTRYLPVYDEADGIAPFRAAYAAYWMHDTVRKLRIIHHEKKIGGMLVGTYTDPNDKPGLDEALAAAKTATWMSVPEGVRIKAEQISTASDTEYAQFVADCRTDMVTGITFASLQILEGQTPDARGDSKVQKSISDLAPWYLTYQVTEAINRQLIPDLIEALGGPHTPAVGWAAGIERLGMLLESQPIKVPVVAVIPTEAGLEDKALAVTAALRRAGVATEMALRGNAKRRAEIARKEGALSILYVRQAGDPMGEYYFSYSGKDDQERNRVARQVSDAIGSTFLLSGIDA